MSRFSDFAIKRNRIVKELTRPPSSWPSLDSSIPVAEVGEGILLHHFVSPMNI
jgi:hypothetical protein